MIDEAKLDALRATHKRIKYVRYNGHDLVFRGPTRLEAKEYKRKAGDEQTKDDADEQLANALLVQFDDNTDMTKARLSFLAMLDVFPFAATSKEIGRALLQLTGVTQDDELKDGGSA